MKVTKIISNIEEHEVGSFKDEVIKRLAEGYCQRIEEAFMKALEENGLPATTKFIRDNIRRLSIDGDNYEHY
jgi:hypothetical protein